MNFVALRMLTGDRAKYLGLIFAIAFCTFLLENQTSIFASILKRTGSQILDVTDADVWVMDGKTEYFEQTKALKDTDLTRVRGVNGVEWAVNFVGHERTELSYVLVRSQPGVNAEEVCRRIAAQTGLRARTTDEFRWDCILYYLKNTGIPVNFGITITIALVVGTVVAGQTFYLFTLENLKQFGALKAIGVTNGRLTGMVLLQAFVVGLMGFGLGTGMAAAFFEATLRKIATRGIILMWQSVALTGGCILFVVIVASLLSIRRVIVLEAATVFRG